MYCEVIAERFEYLKKAKEGQKEMDDLLEVVKKREWDKGRVYGKKEWKIGTTIEFVKRMNEEGLSVEAIAKCLYMPVEEVELYI